MQLTNLPSIHPTQENLMWKQFSMYFFTWRRLETWELVSSLTETRDSSATATLTFLAIGTTSILLRLIQVLSSHEVAGSCSMQDVQSFGHPSCRHKSLYPLLRLNTLPCLNHCKTYFLFWFKKFARRVFKLSVPSPTYTTRFLKTTPVHWNSPGFQSFALVPSTSRYVTITFANT